jgi:hypothetical protein
MTSYIKGTTLYNKILENTPATYDNGSIRCILNSGGTGADTVVLSIRDINSNHPTGNIDITFKDVFIYEGTFCNPPMYKSLDIKPNNRFALINEFPSNQFSKFISQINRTNNVYFRLAMLPLKLVSTTATSAGFYLKLSVGKGYNSYPQICTIVEIFYLVFGSDITDHWVKATNFNPTNDLRLDSFRVTKGGDNNFYLETKVHKSSFSSEHYTIHVLDFFNPDYNMLNFERETYDYNFKPSSLSGAGTVIGTVWGWLDHKCVYHEPGT